MPACSAGLRYWLLHHQVVPAAAFHDIGASAAAYKVVACVTVELLVTVVASEDIVAVLSVERVGASATTGTSTLPTPRRQV